jgi:hypothetical protein
LGTPPLFFERVGKLFEMWRLQDALFSRVRKSLQTRRLRDRVTHEEVNENKKGA